VDLPENMPAAPRSLPTVLIVDDNDLLRQGLRLMLKKASCLVREAANGEAALKWIRESGCDLLVTDDRMPGMRGSELVAKIAAEFPWIPRIVLTGEATLDLAMQAINQGHVFRFLQKPCPPELFQSAVLAGLLEAERLRSERVRETAVEPVETPYSLSASDLQVLSEREEEIRGLLVQGWRLSQISKQLCLSEHTVRNHLKSIFRKWDVHSQSQLIAMSKKKSDDLK
jgi:DNA-binding NarL/FixJ family response regulator